jgi:hypothetical protein
MVKKMIEKPFMTPHAVMRHLLGKKKIIMDLAYKIFLMHLLYYQNI